MTIFCLRVSSNFAKGKKATVWITYTLNLIETKATTVELLFLRLFMTPKFSSEALVTSADSVSVYSSSIDFSMIAFCALYWAELSSKIQLSGSKFVGISTCRSLSSKMSVVFSAEHVISIL